MESFVPWKLTKRMVTSKFMSTGCPKVLARGTFTNYVLFPTKFSFIKMVRILSICLNFVRAFHQKLGKKKLDPVPHLPTTTLSWSPDWASLRSPFQSPPLGPPYPTGSPLLLLFRSQ